MSRFQGYVGITNAMGARFIASEAAMPPILRETAKRGLGYFDDGSTPRSVAGRARRRPGHAVRQGRRRHRRGADAGRDRPRAGRLENLAREHGVAVGVASALPVSIEQIAKWAKALESRGLLLVPLTTAMLKAKQS